MKNVGSSQMSLQATRPEFTPAVQAIRESGANYVFARVPFPPLRPELISDAAEATNHRDVQQNLRAGFTALGMELAKLPLPQGQDTVTMRWTDLPVQLQNTVNEVMDKLKQHMDPKEFDKVTSELQSYKSGVDLATSDQIQSWLSTMVEYLIDN